MSAVFAANSIVHAYCNLRFKAKTLSLSLSLSLSPAKTSTAKATSDSRATYHLRAATISQVCGCMWMHVLTLRARDGRVAREKDRGQRVGSHNNNKKKKRIIIIAASIVIV